MKLRKIWQHRRMKVVLTMMLLWGCIIGTFVLTLFVLKGNQAEVITYIEKQENIIIERNADAIMQQLKEGKTDKQVITLIDENECSTSEKWQFLCVGGYVRFVKDSYYTEKYISDDILWTNFNGQFTKGGYRIVYTKFNEQGQEYMYGMILNEQGILSQAGLLRQQDVLMFMIICLGICCFGIVLWLFVDNERMKTKEIHILNELGEERLKREQATEMVIRKEQEFTVKKKVNINYDRELLEMVLKKSNQHELMPLSIYYMKWGLSERYYTKQELKKLMDKASSYLGSNALMFEVGKGEMVILMYYTPAEQARVVISNMEDHMTGELDIMGIRLMGKLITVENDDRIYEELTRLEEQVKREEKQMII